MSDQQRTDAQKALDRAQFRRRLGLYLLGVAIGLLMLGLMHQARSRAARKPETVPGAATPAQPQPGNPNTAPAAPAHNQPQ